MAKKKPEEETREEPEAERADYRWCTNCKEYVHARRLKKVRAMFQKEEETRCPWCNQPMEEKGE